MVKLDYNFILNEVSKKTDVDIRELFINSNDNKWVGKLNLIVIKLPNGKLIERIKPNMTFFNINNLKN